MKLKKIRIGTRGSLLALKQTEIVEKILKEKFGYESEIIRIKTKGDKILDSPLSKIGGKGVFVKEIEEALLEKKIDIAVHSTKDLPTELPKGLLIRAFLKRENAGDCFLSIRFNTLKDISKGKVGTSSMRRRAIIHSIFPQIEVEDIRGNLDTRIKKLKAGLYDGLVVSLAGVRRLGFEGFIREILSEDTFIPAAGQGAIAIEMRL